MAATSIFKTYTNLAGQEYTVEIIDESGTGAGPFKSRMEKTVEETKARVDVIEPKVPVIMTQAAYDALVTKNPATIYIIT